MISATQASSSISDCALAAVRSNVWRSRLRPPTSIAAPITSRTLPRIEPTSEALTTSCSPSRSAKKAMISSGALPNVTFRKPPMPGPGARGQLLRRAAHQRGRRDHAERRGDEDHRGARVRELERDRDRDERDEQVRPARAAEQEPAQVEALLGLRSRAPELTARQLDEPTVRAGRRTSAPSACRRPACCDAVRVLLQVLGGRAAEPEPQPEPEEPEPPPAPPRPRPPSWPSSSSNGLASEGASIVLVLVEVEQREVERRACRSRAAAAVGRLDVHVRRPCGAGSCRPCPCRSRPSGP